MRLWFVWVGFLLVSGAFAGCVGGGDDLETQEGPDEQPDDDEPKVGGSTGAISGTVASGLFEPLDAEVLLWDQERTEVLEETVAEEGKFTFRELEPATYALQARHPGYSSEFLGANVEAGAVASVEFRLEVVPSDDPYIIEEETRGLVHTYAYRAEPPAVGCVYQSNPAGALPAVPGTLTNCGGGYIPFVPWENGGGTLDMVDDETHTIIVEMFWEPAGLVGENLDIAVWCASANSTSDPCYQRAPQMTSPIQIRIDRDHAEEHDYNMSQVWAWRVLPGYGMLGTYGTLGVDAGLSYEQQFTIHFTVFQREAAPEDYSRLPE